MTDPGVSFTNDIAKQAVCMSKVKQKKMVQSAVVRGDEVTLVGFGYFETVLAKLRTGHNPRTGERADIGEKRRSKFTVARSRPPCWAHPSCPFWPA
ncbi:HU family DNA-binding protein [Verminephrobacter eiseniae]|uniref:HU family DNA-binding protein n=1 Tax=Verminephrobacter eiseniae TaxID=364317 RepID=UPI0022385748|nr:HU family DNA-binding protein [Verminephrobacter eiseniae]MCW5236233.1 DNA-binding protein [Verminephrobacter eiseniae]